MWQNAKTQQSTTLSIYLGLWPLVAVLPLSALKCSWLEVTGNNDSWLGSNDLVIIFRSILSLKSIWLFGLWVRWDLFVLPSCRLSSFRQVWKFCLYLKVSFISIRFSSIFSCYFWALLKSLAWVWKSSEAVILGCSLVQILTSLRPQA